jgi:PPM family protein phosphatase
MINLVAASLTNTGLEREENEDAAWVQVYQPPNREPIGLFIVCDGMGGHMGGKFASYWATEAIKLEFSEMFVSKDPRATVVLTEKDIEAVRSGKAISFEKTEPTLNECVKRAIQKANTVVYEYATHKPSKAANAGTTVTMAVVRGNRAVIANAGDSRTYLIRNHELRQISNDHSVVANMVADGQILPDEVYTHPQRNVIFRFLGQKGMAHIDLFHENLKPGDHLFLCSDGLWEMVRDSRFIVQAIEEASDPLEACKKLVDAANAAGGEDNITVVVVRVS